MANFVSNEVETMSITSLESLYQKSQDQYAYLLNLVDPLPSEMLVWKGNDKEWSVEEIIDHLSIVYSLYSPKLDKVINESEELISGVMSEYRKTLFGRLSIYSQRPKRGKVKFKMKTFDFFEPKAKAGEGSRIIEKFKIDKQKFAEIIQLAKTKNLSKTKVSTALGERVKFYIPECFEFLLAHEERHLVQIEKLIQRQSN